MAEFTAGQIVFSKRGRDKGLPFVIVNSCGEYVYIADGSRRILSKPKKKKLKHIQPVNRVDEEVAKALKEGSVLDAHLRRAIKDFLNKDANFAQLQDPV